MNIKCQHMNFEANVKVARLAKSETNNKITGYMADIKICCAECKREFQFLGLQPGLDLQGSRVSIDGLEAHIAICPQGEQPSPLDNIAVNFNLRPNKLHG